MPTAQPEGDSHLGQPQGVVELREDVPLKVGAGGARAGCCGAGGGAPRGVVVSFAVLTAAVTLALMTQIYAGDYQVVPHGAVSASAAACSRAGTAALQAGGRALDAAAAAALCRAVVAPHQASIDSSGSLLYWEYRSSRTQQPTLVEWDGTSNSSDPTRPPRLLVALAELHAKYGAMPWGKLLQPAVDLARSGFVVSDSLAAAEAAAGVAGGAGAGAVRGAPELADYLQSLQNYSSAELSSTWSPYNNLRWSSAAPVLAGGWRVWAGGARAAAALNALAAALKTTPVDADDAFIRVVSELQAVAAEQQWRDGNSTASGLAVVDTKDTYVALVTGMSTMFGSGELAAGGWRSDEPSAPLDLAPAIVAEQQICGTRYVIGAESAAALAQGAAALITSGASGVEAVEAARVGVTADGLFLEASRPPPLSLPPHPPVLYNASLPYRALNLVQQRADALASHADSRTQGLASRF